MGNGWATHPSFLAGERWVEAPKGTFLRVPAGVTHDFENRGAVRAVAFNVLIPGGFEAPFREWVERDREASG